MARKTALGMFIEAVGINIRAAKNAGVNTRIVVMLAYILSGVCAAIAGVIVPRIFVALTPTTPGCGWSWTPFWRWLSAVVH
ncbi:ABC transporter permease subunit [Escherichia coli]